jgi:GNAT superfamily N-acetyltransferase
MPAVETIRLPRDVPAAMLEALDAADLVSSGRRWQWKYLENPQGAGTALPAWVTLSDGEPVGHLGAMPVRLKVDAAVLDGAWAIDFMTRAGDRRRGIGAALLDKATGSWDAFLTVGQSDASFGLFLKMGWRYLGDLPSFIRVLDARAILGRRLGALGNFGLRLFGPRRRRHPDIDIYRVDEFTDEADAFWRAIADDYRVVVPRDQAYLTWKYVTQPGMNYVRLRAARRGQVRGYAVVRVVPGERPAGLIADVLTHRDDSAARATLLRAAVSYCQAAGCGIVRCLASHESLQRSLRQAGFLRRRRVKVRMVATPSAASRIPLTAWYLTAGDCDIDR